MLKLQDANKIIYVGTVNYYQGLVDNLTAGKAIAILKGLGLRHYKLWVTKSLADGYAWVDIFFDKFPVNHQCLVKNIQVPIRFFGGPPGSKKYYTGLLRNFVCDRILYYCHLNGKTPVHQVITQVLARSK